MSSVFQEIKVKFETITPLWTGDAWMENHEIRPSEILGSLRFWFEVICLASGITNFDQYYDRKNGTFKADFSLKYEDLNRIKNFTDIHNLAKDRLSLPAYIFGATGWKGLIRIKKIEEIELFEYNYLNGAIAIAELSYSKKLKNNEVKKIIPRWYFNKGFLGLFEISFKVYNEIVDSIFYPLLNFVQQYGFLGGKWNIGYGRVRIIEPDVSSYQGFSFDENNSFDFSERLPLGFSVEDRGLENSDLTELIKDLIIEKSQLRRGESNRIYRHKKFGAVRGGKKETLPQGSKVLPLINYNEQTGEYHGLFLILDLLINNKNNKNNGA